MSVLCGQRRWKIHFTDTISVQTAIYLTDGSHNHLYCCSKVPGGLVSAPTITAAIICVTEISRTSIFGRPPSAADIPPQNEADKFARNIRGKTVQTLEKVFLRFVIFGVCTGWARKKYTEIIVSCA